MPTDPMPEPAASQLPVSMIVATIWGTLAAILAIVLLVAAKDEAYGGDAYTGIQNAVMLVVRGIAALLFGSAALGFIIATRRERR